MTRPLAAFAAVSMAVMLAACGSSHPSAAPAGATFGASPASTATPTTTPSVTPTGMTFAQAGAFYLHSVRLVSADVMELEKFNDDSRDLEGRKEVAKKWAKDNRALIKVMKAADWPVAARTDIEMEINQEIDLQIWLDRMAAAHTWQDYNYALIHDKGVWAVDKVRSDLGLPRVVGLGVFLLLDGPAEPRDGMP